MKDTHPGEWLIGQCSLQELPRVEELEHHLRSTESYTMKLMVFLKEESKRK